MPLQFVTGDPLLTRCQTLAIGHNRVGRTEIGDLEKKLMHAFPTAYANYTRKCRQGRQTAGELYLWTQTTPQLLFMTVRDSSVGATRLRHVQKCLVSIARDYRLYGIESLAVVPLGTRAEQTDIHRLFEKWLAQMVVPVIIYEDYVSEQPAGEIQT